MLKDLNYFPLDVESNIYGMTTLQFEDRTNKVLVATLDCRIYCINYNRYKPQTKEVEFTYIPAGAKIISIGALKRGPNDFVIGITHSLALSATTKGTATREFVDSYINRQTTYYFNIYASESVLPSFDLDQVAQGCQTLRLKYVPYHLYSTELIKLSPKASSSIRKVIRVPFWLLSGGDNAMHAFFEDETNQSFNEVPIEEYLPELGEKRGLVLWIDVANIDRSRSSSILFERVVALAYEDGTVRLLQSIMEESTGTFKLNKESCFDKYSTIIPSVRLFRTSSVNKDHSTLLRKLRSQKPLHDDKEQPEALNLLVVGSTNPSLIFRDVLKNGLSVLQELPDSQRLDCSTAASIGDTNTDGFNELLIGTHGKELLTYQYKPSEDRYALDDINIFNYPIFAMSVIDLTGDVLKDVIILLANGILVMQSSTIKDVIETCKRRIKAILGNIDIKQ